MKTNKRIKTINQATFSGDAPWQLLRLLVVVKFGRAMVAGHAKAPK